MIISLTERCSEGCSHCFINSLPRSNTMTEETLANVIKFTSKMTNKSFLISGGEFTEHPDFYDFTVQILQSQPRKFFQLLSNGSWFFDEQKKAKVEKLLKFENVAGMQIRTHPKYYPNFERTRKNFDAFHALSPKIGAHDDGIQLVQLGRARANHPQVFEKKYPPCSNVFLMAKQTGSRTLSNIISDLEKLGKFCAPFLSSKGVLHAGETPYCEEIGTVLDTEEQVLKNILTKCKPKDVCQLYKNLPENYKRVIES
jgi:hypothetical protein